MAQQLTEILSFFLDRFLQEKKGKCLSNTVAWNAIRVKAPQQIFETGLIDETKYDVVGSVGRYGKWTDVPWLGIFRKDITNGAQEGVYVVYLLSSDGSALYLTLNQGVTKPQQNDESPFRDDQKAEKKRKKGEKERILRKNAEIISNAIDCGSFRSDREIHLATKNPGRNYENGTIFYKKYLKGSLPPEEQLKKDLKEMIDIYEKYYDKFYKNPHPISINNPDKSNNEENSTTIENMNTIFFGAPGTGKSYKIDNNLFKDENENFIGMGIKDVPEVRKFRTTFHPDYDYAQFVGAYKPRVDEKSPDKKITYSFVPQVFAKAYAKAWNLFIGEGKKSTSENQIYLVIEEINRGNCAQIFGDIFQLLDRNNEGDEKGFSQYSIDADCDFAKWLEEELRAEKVWDAYKKEFDGEVKLKLPPNLNILATMNTSDQSLFPMDSAFKRRFDWEYVPINYDQPKADFEIKIDDSKKYKWLDFLKKVNADIYDATRSEDKQMGEFFIKPKDGKTIPFEDFRSKVLFYLWDSVYKDETERQTVFHFPYGDGDDKIKSVTFQSLFGKNAEGIVNEIMKKLDVKNVNG
jgi:hypothetical protein